MKHFRKIRERFSVQLSKNPGRIVLLVILLLNIVFIVGSALIISALKLSGTEEMNFWQAAYYTITMILDAGCIDNVVTELGAANVGLAIVCLAVVIIGMVLFTGAVIGYITNYISGFIDSADGGKHKVFLSDHVVILNWNSRASEIVNDLLYCDKKQSVVVLAPDDKELIERELDERLSATVDDERVAIARRAAEKRGFGRLWYRLTHRFRNRLTIIVREGDPFSEKQLRDISIERAKSIVILGDDSVGTVCKYEVRERLAELPKGNPRIIKALALVSDITSAEDSDDDQKIVVESEDDWTGELIEKVIAYKQVAGKCNIIPVNVNRILGRLLSQFSIMPELNLAYRELMSNKGATFYGKPYSDTDEEKYVTEYLKTHNCSLPLSILQSGGKTTAYYCAGSDRDDAVTGEHNETGYTVKLNNKFWLEKRYIVILGHNSKIKEIMAGFNSFRSEWNFPDGGEILDIIVIDDKDHLEKMGYFKDYPYVTAAVEADIYDRDKICETIENFIESHSGADTSVLILSDDLVPQDETDSGAITNLIYVSDILRRKKEQDPTFNDHQLDIIVEILNPKHYDVVKSYSVNNVVISNRYISKMITQIGEKDTLFDFYVDILTYDEEFSDSYSSKEVYVKKVSRFFDEVPAPCTVGEFVRAVYNAAKDPSRDPMCRSHTIVLGYVNAQGKIKLFSGNQYKQRVALSADDKIIVFADH